MLPSECIGDFETTTPVHSDLSAFEFLSDIWEKRNVDKLASTDPSPVLPSFLKGANVIWRAQVNPSTIKTAKGVVVDASPTAALVRFSSRRLPGVVSLN